VRILQSPQNHSDLQKSASISAAKAIEQFLGDRAGNLISARIGLQILDAGRLLSAVRQLALPLHCSIKRCIAQSAPSDRGGMSRC
jgi:hypothetical protein